MSKGKVLVGLSGGVDSSVSALLLKEQGYEVEALFMKNWDDDDGSPYCSAKEDFMDAAFISDQLDIPLEQVSFSKEYRENVFSYFLQELEAGRTPNPDILCNKEIKFKEFYRYAMSKGYDFIATGHYAHTDNKDLYKGIDNSKDQSYFLHAIDKSVLEKTLFPLGNLTKEKVREMAREKGLVTSDKKDSTGICFIGERPFPEFVSNYLTGEAGNIVNENQEIIGSHSGLVFYTLGQRQGLGIGGVKGAPDLPWYVAKKDLSTNVLTCVQGNDHPLLFSNELSTKNIFLLEKSLPESFEGTAKVRYRQKDQECKINIKGDRMFIKFSSPQRSVTPGQSVVIYNGNKCLGGGEIESIN